MKKTILFAILLTVLPFIVKATNYTSVANGNWSNSATWSPAGVPGSGDNVTIATGVTLDANESVNNITINSSDYLLAYHNLTVYGNFIDNGAYYPNTSNTLTFSGSTNQLITFTVITGANFYNLVINTSASTDTVFMDSAITVNNNLTITKGVFATQTYQLGSSGTGTINMASGTTLLLGLKSSSTAISFPAFTTYSLNANSTVVYQANTSSQAILKTPTYGNIDIYTGTSSVTKTLSGSGTLNATGNLTVGDGVSTGDVTLAMGSNTISCTGASTTATISPNGAITFSTGNFGAYNLLISGSGSLSYSGLGYIVMGGDFINNGSSPSTSFIAGNSVVDFDGSSNQIIRGTQTTTFYDILIDEASSTDTVKLGDSTTVTDALELQAGRFDVSKTGNYPLLIKYYINNFGGAAIFVAEKGTVYFGNGGGNVTLGSSYSSTFYNVVCNPGAGNSVNTSGMNMPINNNLLVSSGNFIVDAKTVTVGNNVTISSGATLTYTSGILNVGGNYTDNGTFTYGTGTVNFDGSGSIIQTINGTATQPLNFYDLTIATTSPDTVRLGDSILVNDIFTLTSGVFDVSKNDYELIVKNDAFTNNEGSAAFVARKGCVIFNGAYYINGTYPTIFNDVKVESHYILVNTNETILDTLEFISGGSIQMSSPQILTIGNAFLNYTSGGFSANTGMFQFAGNTSSNNYIGGTQAITLQNFKLNLAHATDTLFLTEGLTVNVHDTIKQGVLHCQNYSLTGSSGTVLDMSSNGTLVLGLKSSSTNVALPTYTSYNLNSGSTVIYQANTASQSISTTPTYGNLVVASGSSITKTPSSSTLTVGGNLTVNSPATLSETSNTINLTGSAIINGTLSYSSGTLNVGSSFINNGTFTYGTSTVNFNGGNDNAVNNTSGTLTFYNFTENLASASDSLFLNKPITVNNNLTITQGILDCQRNQLTNSATPVVSVSPTTSTICAGASTSITASGYSTYSWAPSIGLSVTTGSTINASPFRATTYTVANTNGSKYTCGVGTSAITVNYCEESCSTAIALGSSIATLNAVPVNHGHLWFTFTASGNLASISTHSYPDSLHGRVIKTILYSGTCSSLTKIASDTIHVGPLLGDSLMILNTTTLTSGNTYYLELFSDDSTTGRTFDLHIDKGASTCPTPPACDLISNGDFSSVTSGYTGGFGGINATQCWNNPIASSSPDYYNSFFNSTSPSSGVPLNFANNSVSPGTPDHTGTNGGYAGIIAYSTSFGNNYVEYIQQQLGSQMQAGYTYNVSFWTFLAPTSYFELSATDMGMYLSSCQPNTIPPASLNFDGPLLDCASTGAFITPQIVGGYTPNCPTCSSTGFNGTTWGQITGQYTSLLGGEQYITIGNFNPNTYATVTGVTNNGPVESSAYYYIDDVSITKGVSVNSTSGANLCYGDNATLSVSGGWTHYTWSTGATTSSITVSPTSTTTYSVLVTDGSSCSANTTFTLNVIFQPLVTPTIATICLGDSIIMSAIGADTYSWSPASSLSASTGTTVVATPTANTTYTIVGTGCSSAQTVTISVNPNCCTADCGAFLISYYNFNTYNNGLNISSGTSSTSFGTAPINISANCPKSSGNTSVTIQGTFTVNNNCIIDSCNVAMGRHAKIIVDSLCTLTITNARLYACDSMWQGIIVKPGGTLIVDSTSIIEDAEIAIEAKSSSMASTITVKHSLLNNNYYDIKIDPYTLSAAYPLTLHNVSFTTSVDAFSPNAYLKPPYAGDSTLIGVLLDTVTGTHFGAEAVTIGDPANPAYINHFSNMVYGVFSLSSNFAVFNNYFSVLKGYLSFVGIPRGVGVLASANDYDTTNVSTYYTAIIGSSGANYANAFSNCFRGVDITDYVRLQVDSNYMHCNSNLLNGISGYGDHAVFFKTKGHDSIAYLINNNTIENYSTGIHVLGLLPTRLENPHLGSTKPHSYINSNYIHASSTNVLNTGIQVENQYAFAQAIMQEYSFIQNNRIDSANYCIYLNGLDETYTFVNSNADLYVKPSASSNNTLKAGVYMSNCPYDVHVLGNSRIHADGTYINSTAAAADTDVVGILSYLSTNVTLCSNNVSKIGQGIKFYGDCSGSNFYNNNIDTTYDGLVMDMNGIISTQGYSNAGAGDSWGTYTNFANSQTATYSSYGTNSPLYLLSSAFPTSNYSNDNPAIYSYNVSGALNTATGSIGSCFIPAVQYPSPLHQAITNTSADTAVMIKEMRMTVHDSIPLTGLVPETQFMMKQTVYEELNNNPTLLIKDTALQNFYNRNQNTSIGKIYNMEWAIRRGDYNSLNNFVGTFSPQTTIEQNYKSLADINLNTYFKKVDTLTLGQLATLTGIANQCPLSGGRAVFEARAMLNGFLNTSMIYTDSACWGNSGQGHKNVGKTTTLPVVVNRNAIVYPNPASTLLNVQVQLQQNEIANICLYNSVGEVVRCLALKSNITTLPIEDLSAGIYYYRITDVTGAPIKADKVMVIH
jgi:hypothetical protein